MYVQEISIENLTNADRQEVWETFDLLIGFYRGSGQKLGRIESQYMVGNRMVCLPFTHEADSLGPRYNNYYVNKQTEKLEKLCGSNLKIQTLGKDGVDSEDTCNCSNPTGYLLITDFLTIHSPIRCCSCDRPVPLYRLPIYYDHGYMPILSWESNYTACDRLQMNCEVGERWALRQMQHLDSQLTKQGREICRKIEELSGMPTYCYLYNYSKYKGDDSDRPCPGCGNGWHWVRESPGHYDFKCDKCRIISAISPLAR
ncbi:MAG: DUF2310 family Zn-ribbon-containing protein [Bacteroidia bacterium]